MTYPQIGLAEREIDETLSGQNGYVGQECEIATEDGRAVTEVEYWAKYYPSYNEIKYEWNNGRLEALPMTDYAQYCLYLWFLGIPKDFLHVNPVGRMIELELGFRLALPHKVSVRMPDLAVVLNSNLLPLGDKDRQYRGIFDMCIESISDSKHIASTI